MINLLTAQAQKPSLAQALAMPVIFFVIFYLTVIRPQKKREKEILEMRNNLKVGDVVLTVGGIRGKIVKVKDDILVIESGPEKIKLETTRWAVGVKENKDKKEEE